MSIADNKIQFVRGITDVMARHGEGFDFKIDVYFRGVSVDIVKRGTDNRQRRNYTFDPQFHSPDSYGFAKRVVEEQLKLMGAEFMSMEDFKL